MALNFVYFSSARLVGHWHPLLWLRLEEFLLVDAPPCSSPLWAPCHPQLVILALLNQEAVPTLVETGMLSTRAPTDPVSQLLAPPASAESFESHRGCETEIAHE